MDFQLPPGRAGHGPNIGIAYNGGNGNGVLGIGWTLTGIPFIQRQVDKGLPSYQDSFDAGSGRFRSTDVFVESGGEELVPLSDGTFRAENETRFRRFEFDPAANTWAVTRPDGVQLHLGADSGSRIEDQGTCAGLCSNSGATCASDADCRRTFRWYVSSSVDPNGNRIEYAYKTLPDSPGMVYLHRTTYTLHDTASPAGRHVVGFLYEIELPQDDPRRRSRPDAIADYRSGFEVITAHRLAEVRVCTINGNLRSASIEGAQVPCGTFGGNRVRSYRMEYDDQGACSSGLCASGLKGAFCSDDRDCVAGATRLRRVTQFATDGQTSRSCATAGDPCIEAVGGIPPITFDYTDLDFGQSLAWQPVENLPAELLGDPDVSLVDLNADALPDLLYTESANQFRRWENLGPSPDGHVQFSAPLTFPGPVQKLSTPGTQLADFDGDGIADFLGRLSAVGPEFALFPGTTQGVFSPIARQFTIQSYDSFAVGGFESSDVRLVDLDFDKRIDVLRTEPTGGGNNLLMRRNQGDSLEPAVDCGALAEGDFADGLTFLVDMNGDRLLDLVTVSPALDRIAEISYFPATGRGGFGRGGICGRQGAPVPLAGDAVAGVSADFGGYKGFFWADLTNDGQSDLLWLGNNEVVVWINQGVRSGAGTECPPGRQVCNHLKAVELGGYPGAVQFDFDVDVVRFADLNGNGTRDVLLVDRQTQTAFSLDLADPTRAPTDHVPPTGVPPHLLRTVENGTGKRTVFQYKPSTADYLDARADGKPWTLRSQVPVSVVARRIVSFGLDLDGVGGADGLDPEGVPGDDEYVTEYRYRDAYYDAREREFRGFGEVEEIAHGDASQPTLLRRQRFHTGAPDGVDNDNDGEVDESSGNGGVEEESLKGRLLELREETCAEDECLTVGDSFQHAFNRWEIRRLHSPMVCSGDTDVGCCDDDDCNGQGLGTCVAGSTLPGRLTEHSCASGKTVHFPLNTAARTAVIEREAAPRKDLLVEMDFDDYGNQVADRNWGIVDAPDLPAFGCVLATGSCSDEPERSCGSSADCDPAGTCRKSSSIDRDGFGIFRACSGDPFSFSNPAVPDDERFQTAEFAVNTSAWMVDFECFRETTDENTVLESRVCSIYDSLADSDHVCEPAGNTCEVQTGNLTLRQELLRSCSPDRSHPDGEPFCSSAPLPEDDRSVPRLQQVHDQFGNVVQSLDARGNLREFTYDDLFATYVVVEELHLDPVEGGSHAGGRWASGSCQLDAPAYTLNMTATYHEGLGVVTESTSWGRDGGAGPATKFQYDSFGRVVGVQEPLDGSAAPTVVYEYQLANPDHPSSSDSLHNVSALVTRKREVPGGGSVDTYRYLDGLGRTLQTREEGESAAQWVVAGSVGFNLRGSESVRFQPYFSATSAFESPFAAIPPGGGLCPQGNVDRDPQCLEYDGLGRVVRVRNPPTPAEPGGASRETSFAPLVTHEFDEMDTSGATPSAHVSFGRDGLGRLIQVTERCPDASKCGAAGDYVTKYDYDARGNLARVVDAQGNEKRIEFDSLGRISLLNDPNRGIATYSYDDADNLVESLDANGQVSTFTYDRANRLLTENYLDQTGAPETDPVDVTYVYDSPAITVDTGDGSVDTTRFAEGYLSSVCDRSGTEHLSYDERRRVKWQVKTLFDPLRPSSQVPYTSRYEYDSHDRLTAIVYPDGDRLRQCYGPRGLLVRAEGGANPGADCVGPGGTAILAAVTYEPSGQLGQLTYGNGVVTTYSYDARLRLTGIQTLGAGETAGRELIDYQFTFDPVSNLTAIVDDRQEIPPTSVRNNSQQLEYDDVHRLTRFLLDASGGQIDYRYDAIGDLISQQSTLTGGLGGNMTDDSSGRSLTDLGTLSYGGAAGSSGRIGRNSGSPPGPHALTGTDERDYCYDDNGNVTVFDRASGDCASPVGGAVAQWDYTDNLTSIVSEEFIAQYSYDHRRQRATKLVQPADPTRGGPVVSRYVNPYFEVRLGGQPVKYAWAGNLRVARVEGTLDGDASRLQRFSLHAGWNLFSVAVDGATAGDFGVGGGNEVFRWDPGTSAYEALLSPGDALAAGSVFWVLAAQADETVIAGAYAEASAFTIPSGPGFGGFFPVPGLESLPSSALSPTVEVATLVPGEDRWLVRLRDPLAFLSDLPGAIPSGAAFYARNPVVGAVDVIRPPSTAYVRYFHGDHLGSSNTITDHEGRLVGESFFYPYGQTRAQWPGIADPEYESTFGLSGPEYLFANMELDDESQLLSFGTRYLAGLTGRFASVDPLARLLPVSKLERPQSLNAYAFAMNNPQTLLERTTAHIPSARSVTSPRIGVPTREAESSGLRILYRGAGRDALHASRRNWMEVVK